MGASINAALRQQEKPYNRPAGEEMQFPLWWLAPPPFPRKRGHYKAPLCCELLMKGLLCGALLSHRSAGGRWCRKAPKGGKSHRRWLITVVLTMPYGTESKSRNADFILIAQEGDTTTLGAKGPSTLTPAGRVHGRSPLNLGHPVVPMCDTTTLGPTGPIKLTNPPAHWAGQT